MKKKLVVALSFLSASTFAYAADENTENNQNIIPELSIKTIEEVQTFVSPSSVVGEPVTPAPALLPELNKNKELPNVEKHSVVDEAPVAAEPAIDPKKPLMDALIYVYQNHPQLLAEREKLKAIDESVALAVSDFRPNATADYSKGRERTSARGAPWDYGDNSSKGVTVTQPLFSGGDGVAGFISAKERVKAARADLVAVEQQVLFEAVVAFSDMVEKQSTLELNQKNVDVLTKQREATQVRFEVGELTKTDVAQSESRLANAKSDERNALGDVEIARANFARAIGYASPEKLSMPELPPALPKDITEAERIAHESSPVLEAAKHREKAFESDVWSRVGDILPDVSLQGSARRGKGGFSGQYDNDSLTVNVSVPLYQSGAEWSRLREARNLASQAKFQALDAGLAVSQSASSAWQNFATAQAVIVSSQAAVDASKIALEGVRQENEFGVRTVLDVLDAEQEYLDAQVNLVRAIRNEKIQAYRLLASTGQLTAAHLALPVEAYDPKEYYNSKKYQLLGW